MPVKTPHTGCEITISPRAVARVLTAAILLLTAMHVFVQVAYFGFGHDNLLGLTALLDMNRETNVPTWYSVAVFLATAAALAVIAAARRQAGAPFARHWAVLAVIFVYLSLDELTRIHEKWGALLQQPLGHLRSAGVMGGVFRNLWVIPAGLIALVVGLSYLRFLVHLPSRTRALFVASGVAFVTAAVGMEMVGASYSAAGGRYKPGFMVLVTIEETLEMASIALFLYAVLTYAGTTLRTVLIRIPEGSENTDTA